MSQAAKQDNTGLKAVQAKGWWRAYKWLVLRRFSQLSVIALFLIGPLLGVWLIKGSMMSSLVLDTVPLSDPFIFIQTLASGFLASGFVVEQTMLIGVIIVALFYFIVGGRVYCSWVCPINMVTDSADWLRRKLNIKSNIILSRNNRIILLISLLIVSLFSGMLVWELVNPVTMFQREIVFGMGFSWMLVLGIFILDAFISRRAWCGHLCPMGKFYAYLGQYSFIRVNALQRNRCDDCMDCFTVCPEPQVIKPALKGKAFSSPVILSGDCTNCGQCIDVCAQDVFSVGHRFTAPLTGEYQLQSKPEPSQREVNL